MRISKIILPILFFYSFTFSSEKLIAGLFNIVPYAYMKENKVVGITADIIQNLENESQVDIETTLLPYKRMLVYLESGKIDFAIFFVSDFSESFSEKLVPLYSLDTIIIGKKDLKILTFEDIRHLQLATPLGVNYNEKLGEDKSLQIHYVKDYRNAILMLKRNSIDALIGPRKILQFQLEQLGMNINELGEPYVLTTNTAWIQFSNKSKLQKHKPKLIKAAKKLLEKKKVNEIILKYYPK